MTISLITATYNSGKTVEDTLRSVLAQTYKEIDYWVVDGGSKDDTMDIVRKYEPLFGGRLHWISEPDRGIYDAMNKGISHSTGDVVGILNSDDHFTSNDVLERVAAEMQAQVTVETYVQATQSWWNNQITVYAQSEDGAYFIYNMECSEENAAKLVPGAKIRVTGYKSE